MSAARALTLVNSWDTIRFELLNTPVCDLGLAIEGSPVEPHTKRLTRELYQRGLGFQPEFYLTDGWGCPDQVPVIGIPFYLADKRLALIEEEQTGEIETEREVMMLLRHEAGHAMNYAFRLYRNPEWAEVFGPFSRPYKDSFRPNPWSRQFVRHIAHHRYGRTYAQKHPDEDFAETFAVWLTPRSGWRRRYRNWPALQKLQFVDRMMRDIRAELPRYTGGDLCTPVDKMTMPLAEHYGQRAERYRAAAQGYVDDKLREVFPGARGRSRGSAVDLIRANREEIVARIVHWSGLEEAEASTLVEKLEDRAETLGLQFPLSRLQAVLMDVTALATALAMDFVYTGQFTG